MSVTNLLPADEDCSFSGLPKAFCAHCTGDDEDVVTYGDDEVDYEIIGRTFEAQFPGHCTIEYDHLVKRGTLVAKVQRADNPMLPISGVACNACMKMLPRAK